MVFYAFDLLFHNGEELRRKPQLHRKRHRMCHQTGADLVRSNRNYTRGYALSAVILHWDMM
jgi:hypothetical protein